MISFFNNLVYNFLISFGVILGASSFAGIGALINNQPPFKIMSDVAASIKIWAVIVALGGTFSSFEIIEQGIFKGEIKSVIKQIGYIIVALIGANLGYSFIKLIKWCSKIWIS
ncbi:YtrH family sporulation protein [Tepidibacter thalassicus]|uniref:Sporulation protein YtrH n=1 Tax=Tepidibacter thalassicus DSM 15285 TaxID=1123350 RepID=A0A1M5NZ76_9FIRM|nr:YtrH family sporulation protein [Tepidibacter thalassicus]SHG94874.1 Sporulation protein YtrH [Tepidibacter thalassicus DSM 15285]